MKSENCYLDLFLHNYWKPKKIKKEAAQKMKRGRKKRKEKEDGLRMFKFVWSIGYRLRQI